MSDIGRLPEQEYMGSNIVQIRPQENISKGNFNGQCTFVIDIAKDEMILPQSIYLAGRVSLASSEFATVGGAYVTTRPLGYCTVTGTSTKPVGCIAAGGLDNCFSKLSHEISGLSGSSVVQNIENYQQTCSLLRLSHEYPLSATKNNASPHILVEPSKITSGNSMFTTTDHIGILNATENTYSATETEYVIRNAYRQGLDQNYEVSLSTKLACSMFLQEHKLYQGQHIIRLTIDPQYRQKFVNVINLTGTNTIACGTPSSFNGTYRDSIAATGNVVVVNVNDLYLYVEYVKINVPMGRPMGKHLYVFESWNSTLHSCVNANSDNFILPCKPNLLKIIMGLRTPSIITDGGAAGTSTRVPALINPEYIGFNPINLGQIRVKYLSDTYPQTDYTMMLLNSYRDAVATVVNNRFVSTPLDASYDSVRAYEDYYVNSEFDNGNHAMSYDEWKKNPVFIFKFCNTSNQASNVEINLVCNSNLPALLADKTAINADVTVSTSTELNGAILYLLYVYRTIVEVDFEEDHASYKVFNIA